MNFHLSTGVREETKPVIKTCATKRDLGSYITDLYPTNTEKLGADFSERSIIAFEYSLI